MERLLKLIKKTNDRKGQLLIEAIVAMGISAIILPALLTGLITAKSGKSQQAQRAQAIALLKG